MRVGFAALVAAYVLSQFYRAFLAVLAPELSADLGMSKEALADASGLWFLGFALAQLPIGFALDHFGPRRSAGWLMLICGGGGALLFALATRGGMVQAAMVLIGIGCAPVLMATFYIFARSLAPKVFASYGAMVVGVGSIGNLAAALPLSLAVAAFGWRATVLVLAVVTAVVAGVILRFVKDPPRVQAPQGADGYFRVIQSPGFWAILVMLATSYAGAAAIRGLWAAPYVADIYQANAAQIGTITLLMGGAMVLGSFAYGPLDRLLGTRKWVAFGGNLLGGLVLVALWRLPDQGLWISALLLAGVGFFGSSYSLMMAHGRAFFPPHLIGRGVTLLNLFSIGGAGVFQMVSGRVFTLAGPDPIAAYTALMGYFALVVIGGCVIYLAFAKDRVD